MGGEAKLIVLAMDLVCMPQEYAGSRTPVLLQTYSAQVGGHTPLFLLGEGVVCKPTISREKFFYESIPPAVRHFTPYFHGEPLLVIQTGCAYVP